MSANEYTLRTPSADPSLEHVPRLRAAHRAVAHLMERLSEAESEAGEDHGHHVMEAFEFAQCVKGRIMEAEQCARERKREESGS